MRKKTKKYLKYYIGTTIDGYRINGYRINPKHPDNKEVPCR